MPAPNCASLRLLTNIPDFPRQWSSAAGTKGTAQIVSNVWDFLKNSPNCDAILINCDPSLTFKLAALFSLIASRRKPIIALDLVLRRPITTTSKLARPLKKQLLKGVSHFVHYFRQWDGYEKYFGIAANRSSYVPFKTDIRGRFPYAPDPNGEYVLCFGRSERDFDTFIRAMRNLPFPGAIPKPNVSLLKQHSSRLTFPLSQLPPNITVLENEDTVNGALRMIARARLIALPLVAGRISASGIGTYLTAMLWGSASSSRKGQEVRMCCRTRRSLSLLKIRKPSQR